MIADGLRPPSALDPDAELYKDWLHLNLFEPASGLVGLVNVALHGAPDDPRARAVGTAIVHLPGLGWVGNVEGCAARDASVGERFVGLRGVALALGEHEIHASAALPADRLALKVSARPDTARFEPRGRLAPGRGWMRWSTILRLRAHGEVRVHDRTVRLAGATAYHDHNWGRWAWGDDLGWEWGCFPAAEGGLVAVLSRTTDRDHRAGGRPHLLVLHGERRRVFLGTSVRFERSGALTAPPRRLPGALAALNGDRARPRLPAHVDVHASDGHDELHLRFTSAAAAQLVVAEVTRPGYGFIHEIAGSFTLTGRLGGDEVRAEGAGIFEHVD